MILTGLFYAFVIVVILQCIFYGIVFSQFSISKDKLPKRKNIGVSVLVCAKNEAENLKAFIPKIIDQNYPQFEIILINDASSDDSLEIMKTFEAQHSNIKVVDVKQNDAFRNSKKYALTLGIKVASYNFLLFTDADCEPSSSNWITSMSSHFSKTKTIVIGYGAYQKVKGSLLNILIRFETMMTAIQYFSYTKLGMPYMAVGRNLAYRKEVFFETNGFFSHMHILSGDDDLFINEAATNSNTPLFVTRRMRVS